MAQERLARLAVTFFTLTMLTHTVHAIPVGGTLQAEHTENFTIADASATVQSQVYRYNPGLFVYAYQISNTCSAGLSLFSVAIIPGADAFDPTYDPASNVVEPAYWAVVGTPIQSVDYLFADTIDNDGITSAVLWYRSSYSPTTGQVVLCGTWDGTPCTSIGSVLTPSTVPEPATISLFAIGTALMVLARRRRL